MRFGCLLVVSFCLRVFRLSLAACLYDSLFIQSRFYLRLDIYNATKSMIYKYSRRTTPGDDELPLISDSVLTTRCELSKCSLQRDVNEVFLFHGTSVCGNPPQFCPTFDDSMTVCYPSASLGRYFAQDYRPRHRRALFPVDWFIWCRLLFFRSVQQSRPGYHTLARNMCTYGCHT